MISARIVGKTIYLLSEGGRLKAMIDKTGDAMKPSEPILGSVNLAVGELNLNLCSNYKTEKNIKFLILIYLSPALVLDENYYEWY